MSFSGRQSRLLDELICSYGFIDSGNSSPQLSVFQSAVGNTEVHSLEYELFRDNFKIAVCGKLDKISGLVKILEMSLGRSFGLTWAVKVAQEMRASRFGFKFCGRMLLRSEIELQGVLFYLDFAGSLQSALQSLNKFLPNVSCCAARESKLFTEVDGFGIIANNDLIEFRIYGTYLDTKNFESVSFDRNGNRISRKSYFSVSKEMLKNPSFVSISPVNLPELLAECGSNTENFRLGLRFGNNGNHTPSILVKV